MKKISLLMVLIFALYHLSFCADLYDCALLYDQTNVQNSDKNFKKLANFYGLKCMEINIPVTPPGNELLKDESGRYFRIITINANNLVQFLTTTELTTLKHLVDSAGVNLLVSGLNDQLSYLKLKNLTNDVITGAAAMNGNNNWHFTTQVPPVTSDFTGLSFAFRGNDRAFSLNTTADALPILQSQDNDSTRATVFAMIAAGKGKFFLDGCIQKNNLDKYQMLRLYRADYLNDLIPTMIFLKYAGAQECWHNDNNYANLTIDDPYFREPHYNVKYHELLVQMQTYNFHTTIAFIPERFFSNPQDPSVIKLFLKHPDRYSIVQHGNNHDGYEFICYTREQFDTLNARYNNTWIDERPRPYREQEADIVEGKTRMGEIERVTGISCGNTMVFPWGISLSPTLALLKAYNFNATVNDMYKPKIFLEGDDNSNYDFNLRPANMNFGNFAVVKRWHAPPLFQVNEWPFQAFLDKPLLLFAHGSLFADGIDQFNDDATFFNNFFQDLQWLSLGDITKRMYLEKMNDDSSITVTFYGNQLVYSNETNKTCLYHFQKQEWGKVPIIEVQVDSYPISYSIIDSMLTFDLAFSPRSSREIKIIYSSGNKDFAITSSDIMYNRFDNKVSVQVHNNGSNGGPCPVQIFLGEKSSGPALCLTTIERVGAESTQVIQVALPNLSPRLYDVYLKLDPHNIILESNEDNNEARAKINITNFLLIDDFEYDDSPLNHQWAIGTGAGQVSTIYDASLKSRVLEAAADEKFDFSLFYPASGYLDIKEFRLSVKIKSTEFFKFDIMVQDTSDQNYHLQYIPDNVTVISPRERIIIPLGPSYRNGQWHRLERNLYDDLMNHTGIPLKYVKRFCISGSYYLDDLMLRQQIPTSQITETYEENDIIHEFKLNHNYPNPFNNETTIHYQVSKPGDVSIFVYNFLGQKVKTLVQQYQEPGCYSIQWNGTDDAGIGVASGIYFYQISVGENEATQKMLLMK